jgi:uncharacterized repeat protein (TIGR01451 family)
VTSLPYGDITWTIVVKNSGTLADTNVQLGDPMPAGNTFVSVTTTVGTCTGGAVLSCQLGTMQPGDTVTITLVTNPTLTGDQVNTATVVGDLAETNTTNNTATATVKVVGVGKPKTYCTAVSVTPRLLYAGRTTTMHLIVTNHLQKVKGVRVRITGPGLFLTTAPSNSKGRITQRITPRKAGIVIFKPIAVTKSCRVPRVGITGVFTPPVTG